MWTRAELKENAKNVLRKYYWPSLGTLVIMFFISGAAGILNFIPVLGSIAMLFISLPLTVGMYSYFLNARKDKADIADIFNMFKGGKLFKVTGALLWVALFDFLWSLLFVIPGIIKAIAYSMVPFILADNPDIGYKRAIKLSIAMTNGQKADMFVLYLSFIGWFLLGALACGIGTVFVYPYFYATLAELYTKLKEKALNEGLCTYQELNAITPAAAEPAN